jgi:plastocyanin
VRIHTADHVRPWRISTFPILALFVGALAMAGCGGSKSTNSTASTAPPAAAATTESTAAAPTTAPAGGLSLTANPEGQLKYDKTSLSAKAGTVAIDFTNMSQLGHNMTVESSSGSVAGATPTFSGESKTLTLKLTPGTYKFYCSVPGHRQAGMEGTLVVK